jgi:hypothetical protein
MADPDIDEVVRMAWQAGAAMAFLSLKEENMAHSVETDELQLPDHSEEGADVVRYILQTAPNEDQLLMHACRLAAAAVGADDKRTELDKRMLYRQMVIAAGYCIGKPEDAQFLAESFEEVLLLNPDGA